MHLGRPSVWGWHSASVPVRDAVQSVCGADTFSRRAHTDEILITAETVHYRVQACARVLNDDVPNVRHSNESNSAASVVCLYTNRATAMAENCADVTMRQSKIEMADRHERERTRAEKARC